jgi:hypothetical protein
VGDLFGICAGIGVSFALNRKYSYRADDLTLERAIRLTTVGLFGMCCHR